MNTYSFPIDDNKKIYEQIYQRLRQDIINGNIKPNEKLPSKRILASSLGVSIHSIITAYSLLLEEGYIYTKPKSGYYVNSIEPLKKEEVLPLEASKASTIIYDFKTSAIDFSLFPKTQFNQIAKDIITNSKDYLERATLKGDLGLRQEISKYLYEYKDIKAAPSQIIVSSGSEDMMRKLVKLLGINKIAIENPGYHRILKSCDVKVDYIPLDQYGLDVTELAKSDAKLTITTPYSQFPTGIKMNLKRKQDLIKLMEERNGYIIEDSFDSNLKNTQVPTTSLFSLSNKVIYMESFSRTLFPGFCLSFMVLPKELVNSFDQLFKDYSSNVSTLNQLILKELLSNESFYRHVNRLRVLNKKKREKIISSLDSNLFDILPTNNYISVLATIKGNKDIEKIKREFTMNGISIQFINEFSYPLTPSNTLMIGYSGIFLEQIPKAVEALESIIKKY